MFKRKPIYIVLLIVFSLLLGADILAYSLTAGATSRRPTMPDGTQGGFPGGTRPEVSGGAWPGANNGERPEVSGGAWPRVNNGERPEVSGGAWPEASDGTMPEMSGGTMPGNFDPSQITGGFNGQGMPGGFASGFAGFIGNWWIPIGIFCVLADTFCIFMLIRIGKRQKCTQGEASEEAMEEAEAEQSGDRKPQVSGYEKRRRKRRRTIRIVIILFAILLAIVLGYFVVRGVYLAQLKQENEVSVVSAEAVGAEIDTAISGTGTLADAEAEEVTVPVGVNIASYNVENGDTVTEGDILATVDHTSVIKAIAGLQDAMDALDEEIKAASSEEIGSKITASVDGRVKVVYAQAGTAVVDTMYDNGALVLISLGGLMAADIETDAAIAAGDSVTVTLSDGTELSGRVGSVAAGIATVTVSDEIAAYGEQVAVSDSSGSALGSGTLYIHSELKVTGFSGTVAKVKCAEGDEVSAGDTLLTLTDTEYTAEYQLLLQTRGEYEDEMLRLFKLYHDGNIYAKYAGTISGVNEDTLTHSAALSTDYDISRGSSGTDTETTEEEAYAISETAVMSVTPSDALNVTITVDELDILSLKESQEAVITLDALSGQTFTGSVTSIDTAGTNSGGSTKFTAVVTLDRTDEMLAGMNAAVSITLSQTQCAVTIPVAALTENGGSVSVYTSYDEESGVLGDPVSVETGLSDGTSVEILSGLNSGDTVFYAYDDTVDISSSVISSSDGGFNLMRLFSGGGRRG